jgi:predicted permease
MIPAAGLLLGIFSLVLFIACINVVGLLLARAALRQKEIAVRLAIGASRSRLIRQLLTESLVLFSLGGGLGLLFSYWFAGVLLTLAPADKPIAIDSIMDGRSLAFTLLVSLLTGAIFGLAPALQASKPNLIPALKSEAFLPSGNRRKTSLRDLFLIAQVAFSVVLLVCAGIFIRSLQNVKNIQLGFEVENGIVVPIELGLLRYTKENGQDFYNRVVSRIEALPGVRSASLLKSVPLGSSYSRIAVYYDGLPSLPEGHFLMAGTNIVGTDYFRTMGIPLARGRDFTEQDREGGGGVVIINETAARQYWPDQDPIGKRIKLGGPQGQYCEVIGVARDGKDESLSDDVKPFIFQPLLQNYSARMHLLVRTDQNPAALVGTIRRQLLEMEKNLVITQIRTLSDMVNNSMGPVRAAAWLLGVFGLLALVLAAVGLYGALTYSVSQRTREIGIRISLGALPRDVLMMVLGDGMKLVLKGMVLGVILALGVTHALASFVYGTRAADPIVFLSVLLLLSAISFVASYIPARRGTKVDPVIAIRFE